MSYSLVKSPDSPFLSLSSLAVFNFSHLIEAGNNISIIYAPNFLLKDNEFFLQAHKLPLHLVVHCKNAGCLASQLHFSRLQIWIDSPSVLYATVCHWSFWVARKRLCQVTLSPAEAEGLQLKACSPVTAGNRCFSQILYKRDWSWAKCATLLKCIHCQTSRLWFCIIFLHHIHTPSSTWFDHVEKRVRSFHIVFNGISLNLIWSF